MALTHLMTEIRSATSSMTSVPKPLKFLRPHYATLKTTYTALPDGENKKFMADILAVLAMTMAAEGSRETLTFKLAGSGEDLGSWGHEFVRSLAGEIGQEYQARQIKGAEEDATSAAPDVSDLMKLVDHIVPFHIQHNAEAEAIDLLIEVQQLSKLKGGDIPIDANNFARVCLYLLRCADYMADPDDLAEMLAVAYEIYKAQAQYPDAIRVAIRIGDSAKYTEIFGLCEDALEKKQLCLILARHRVNFDYPENEVRWLMRGFSRSEGCRHGQKRRCSHSVAPPAVSCTIQSAPPRVCRGGKRLTRAPRAQFVSTRSVPAQPHTSTFPSSLPSTLRAYLVWRGDAALRGCGGGRGYGGGRGWALGRTYGTDGGSLDARATPPRHVAHPMLSAGPQRADREQQPQRQLLEPRARPRRDGAQDARGHLQVAPLRDRRVPPRGP